MDKERYNQIIDEAYRKYADSHEYFVDGWLHVIPMFHNKETFVIECKKNPEFSEKWGLKIEERMILEQVDQTNPVLIGSTALRQRKLITLTYNNETIESYE